MKLSKAERAAQLDIDEALADKLAAEGNMEHAMAGRRMRCCSCGKRSRMDTWMVAQTQWYVRPYSCMGGDYWKDGEKKARCPKCGVWNRFLDKAEQIIERYYRVMIRRDPYRCESEELTPWKNRFDETI